MNLAEASEAIFVIAVRDGSIMLNFLGEQFRPKLPGPFRRN